MQITRNLFLTPPTEPEEIGGQPDIKQATRRGQPDQKLFERGMASVFPTRKTGLGQLWIPGGAPSGRPSSALIIPYTIMYQNSEETL